MFSQASVILSTGVGVHIPLTRHPMHTPRTHPALTHTPFPGHTHTHTHTPWTPPPLRRLLQQTVHILLECILITNIIFSIQHSVGRALSSYWATDSFIMVVYENIFSHALNIKFLFNLKKSSHRQP